MKITDFKVVYICPDHNDKYHTRKVHMDALLTRMGFKDIVHFKSGTESYPTCLAIATKEILIKYMDEPFLLLEDDVHSTDQMEFDCAEGTDAIYFGLCRWRGSFVKNEWEGPVTLERYSKNQVRVLNMLTAHAILFISKQYKSAVIDAMDEAITTKSYNDVMMSRIQHKFQVLANTVPTFYQSFEFNEEQRQLSSNVETSTKIHIDADTLNISNFS